MGYVINNRFKYFKDINQSLKQKYHTDVDFPESKMAKAIDDIPSGGSDIGIVISSTSDTPIFFGINTNGFYVCDTEEESTPVALGRTGGAIYAESV